MRDLDSKRSEILAEEARRHNNGENKTRILIVDGRPKVRQGLVRLVAQESDLGICVEAEDARQALEAIERQQIDMAIVDISPPSATSVELAESIRFQYPNLPLLTISMGSELHNYEQMCSTGASEYIVSRQATEKILAAINYVESLLKTQFSGFTVLVKA